MSAMHARKGLRDERGAAMVFGLFFAVFLIAVVYQAYGLGEAVLYRQYVQDVADSAAFSAAVVNARGMNLLALINMTMAAALSVLVGLKVAETIGLVGIGVCVFLAYPTYGNSLNAVPGLTKATKKIHKMGEQVKDVLPAVLSGLHAAGKAVSVVVPIGANVRVIDTVSLAYATPSSRPYGLAIPGRFTLPIEDGEFPDMCRHAGDLAARLAMLPLSPVLPNVVEDKLAGAMAAITQAGSDWFCDAKNNKPPRLDGDRKYDVRDLPRMPKRTECEAAYAAHPDPTEAQQRELDALCDAAELEQLASVPGRDGKGRDGEALCPTDCATSDRASCPPEGIELCEPDQVKSVSERAAALGQFALVPSGENSPYRMRLAAAREQCDPGAPHDGALGGVWWLERQVRYTYTLKRDRKTMQGAYELSSTETGDEELRKNKDEDRALPCGSEGIVGERYDRDATRPVCESPAVCLDGTADENNGPCRRDKPARGSQREKIVEQVQQVTAILRCAELLPHKEVETPPLDLAKEMNEANENDENTNPFRLEKNVWLGGSDFQLRAVVWAPAAPNLGEKAVAIATWDGGSQADDDGAGPIDRIVENAETAGRVGLSQAEYFFDLGTFADFGDQQDDQDVIEWLWNQGWTARMRPFRLSYKKADGPREKEPSLDEEQSKYAKPAQAAVPGPELDFSQVPDKESGEAQQIIDVFGDGDESED